MLVALLLAVAAARPQDEPIKILKQSQEHDTDSGKYSFRSVPMIHIFDLILPVWIRMVWCQWRVNSNELRFDL